MTERYMPEIQDDQSKQPKGAGQITPPEPDWMPGVVHERPNKQRRMGTPSSVRKQQPPKRHAPQVDVGNQPSGEERAPESPAAAAGGGRGSGGETPPPPAPPGGGSNGEPPDEPEREGMNVPPGNQEREGNETEQAGSVIDESSRRIQNTLEQFPQLESVIGDGVDREERFRQ